MVTLNKRKAVNGQMEEKEAVGGLDALRPSPLSIIITRPLSRPCSVLVAVVIIIS